MTAAEARKLALPQWMINIEPVTVAAKKIISEIIIPRIRAAAATGDFHIPFSATDIPEEYSGMLQEFEFKIPVVNKQTNLLLQFIAYLLVKLEYTVYGSAQSVTIVPLEEEREATLEGFIIRWGDMMDFNDNHNELTGRPVQKMTRIMY
jgi:hypothetical protein